MSPSHRILLTGANGYIASHILSQLLASPAKHSVRAIIRSLAKVDSIKALFPTVPSTHLDYAIVPDITVPGAFDEALKSSPPFSIVIHTASPFLFKAATSAADFFEPAIKGTTEMLEGIQRVTPKSVARVILVSSFAAIGAFGLVDERHKIYTEDDWNPQTLQGAEEEFAQGNKGPAYYTSKTYAERAAWEFKEKTKSVKWDLVTLSPPMVYGPIAHKVTALSELNESVACVYEGFLAAHKPEDELIPDITALYVDVRDLARAHVLAMDVPGAANQRFSINPGEVRVQEISDLLRAEVYDLEHRVPRGEPGKDTKPHDAIRLDSSKAERVFGLMWRTKETFRDLGEQLLEIE